MTYEDLPYKYKGYAKDKEWEEDQALAYYQQAKEFREYMELQACLDYRYYANAGQAEVRGTFIVDNFLQCLRGEGVKLS